MRHHGVYLLMYCILLFDLNFGVFPPFSLKQQSISSSSQFSSESLLSPAPPTRAQPRYGHVEAVHLQSKESIQLSVNMNTRVPIFHHRHASQASSSPSSILQPVSMSAEEAAFDANTNTGTPDHGEYDRHADDMSGPLLSAQGSGSAASWVEISSSASTTSSFKRASTASTVSMQASSHHHHPSRDPREHFSSSALSPPTSTPSFVKTVSNESATKRSRREHSQSHKHTRHHHQQHQQHQEAAKESPSHPKPRHIHTSVRKPTAEHNTADRQRTNNNSTNTDNNTDNNKASSGTAKNTDLQKGRGHDHTYRTGDHYKHHKHHEHHNQRAPHENSAHHHAIQASQAAGDGSNTQLGNIATPPAKREGNTDLKLPVVNFLQQSISECEGLEPRGDTVQERCDYCIQAESGRCSYCQTTNKCVSTTSTCDTIIKDSCTAISDSILGVKSTTTEDISDIVSMDGPALETIADVSGEDKNIEESLGASMLTEDSGVQLIEM